MTSRSCRPVTLDFRRPSSTFCRSRARRADKRFLASRRTSPAVMPRVRSIAALAPLRNFARACFRSFRLFLLFSSEPGCNSKRCCWPFGAVTTYCVSYLLEGQRAERKETLMPSYSKQGLPGTPHTARVQILATRTCMVRHNHPCSWRRGISQDPVPTEASTWWLAN